MKSTKWGGSVEQSNFFTDEQRKLNCFFEKMIRLSEQDEPLVYTVEQTAAKLQVSKSKAYELARCGEIPSVKIGGRVMIPRQRLEEWLNEQAD